RLRDGLEIRGGGRPFHSYDSTVPQVSRPVGFPRPAICAILIKEVPFVNPAWVSRLVPVEFLVPQPARKWRPPVADAFQHVCPHPRPARLSAQSGAQMQLRPDTPPARRVLLLISPMPGLQKIGQVLARTRRLSPALRAALTELENGMSDVTAAEI